MAAPALVEVAADPLAAMRALNKMTRAGFALSVRADRLIVAPADRLTEQQSVYIRAHKAALVALLADAEILHEYLVQAGPAGLAFREGTPGDWSDARLLAAGEVLYTDKRMVNRRERRYLKVHAPPMPDFVPDSQPATLYPALERAIAALTVEELALCTPATVAALSAELPVCAGWESWPLALRRDWVAARLREHAPPIPDNGQDSPLDPLAERIEALIAQGTRPGRGSLTPIIIKPTTASEAT